MTELRPALSPAPVAAGRVAELRAAIQHIETLLDRGEPAGAEIAAFNAGTGHRSEVADFSSYHESHSIEQFALEAARPSPQRVPDVTRAELIEVVRRIMGGGPDTDFYLDVLEANVVHPRVSDLIFYPAGPEPTPESVVDEALSYRPIAL